MDGETGEAMTAVAGGVTVEELQASPIEVVAGSIEGAEGGVALKEEGVEGDGMKGVEGEVGVGMTEEGDIMSESLEQNHRFGCWTGGVKSQEEERQNSEVCKDKATRRLVEQVNLQNERFVTAK